MEVPTHHTFQIALSPDHLQTVLNGLAELPYKQSNSLIKYIQQQVQNQVTQARAAAQPSKEEVKNVEDQSEEKAA